MKATAIFSLLMAAAVTVNSMATTGDRNLARGFVSPTRERALCYGQNRLTLLEQIEARCHCDGTCCNGSWCTDDGVGPCCDGVPC